MYLRDSSGNTALNVSLNYYNNDIAEFFMSSGYVLSPKEKQQFINNQLFNSIKKNDLDGVKEAVNNGADVNTQDLYGTFPLCISYDNIIISEYLLENGADPNMQDNYGISLLHKWSYKGLIDSIKLLLKYKADMKLKKYRERDSIWNSYTL